MLTRSSCIQIAWRLLHIAYSPIAFLLKLLGVRVVHVHCDAIGMLALEPNIYLKEQQLLGKKYYTVLLAAYSALHRGPPYTLLVSNRFLLEQWKEHFFIVTNFFLYLLLLPLLKSPMIRYETKQYFAVKNSPFYIQGRSAAEIYWRHRQGSHSQTPFLRLKANDLERGQRILKELGLPVDAWYVCFNCREPGYYSSSSEQWARCRNATIENLELGLQEVIRRGGWCIRLGSVRAAPLPGTLKQHKKIIDYPHTPQVSDFMDIFLAATCRFFIGNTSGITNVPAIYGVPCVCTNVLPIGIPTFFLDDLVIFKLHRSKISGRYIPFSQCFQSSLCNSICMEDFEEFQVELVENTHEEIDEVVTEMLDRLDNRLHYLPEEEELQQRFLSLRTSFNLCYYSPLRAGTKFLQRYRYLIE